MNDTQSSPVFDNHAHDWWNEKGAFHPLHALNPCRIDFLLKHMTARNLLKNDPVKPLMGIKILDVGCGGGIFCEPLARLGGDVTGIDLSAPSIEVARAHSQDQGLSIVYETRALNTIDAGTFDIVIASEVIEHVDDPAQFTRELSGTLKPGGCAMITTLNRTWKSYVLGIFVAENILKWAPKGAHEHHMFIKPSELASHVTHAGMALTDIAGLVFSPLTWSWSLDESKDNPDLSINYFAWCEKPCGDAQVDI